MKQTHFIIYKTTNLINGKIYIGAHKTSDLNDGYMGSGRLINSAFSKYGKENFKTEILHELESLEEMYSKEAELVNEEFLKRDDVYNLKLGGQGGWDHLNNMIAVKDIDGNTFSVNRYDDRYLSGELVGVSKGLVTVRDEFGDIFNVSVNDEKYLSNQLIHVCVDRVIVKDIDGNTFSVNRYDDRYLSGELVGVSKGFHHSVTTKNKIGHINSIYQSGDGNSQFGTMWIYSLTEKINKKVPKGEIPDGWLKGRKMKFD